MRRTIANILIIIIAFAVENSIFPFIPFLNVVPNLLLIITFTIAFSYGEMEGLLYGLLCGILYDLFYSGPFGFYTIIFIWIGYLNGYFSKHYYDDYILLPALMCTINELVYNLYIFIFRFLINGRTDILLYLRNIILPETVITVVIALLIYRPILALNRVLKKADDRKKGMNSIA